MGRIEGAERKRKHGKSDKVETEHFDDWPLVPPCFGGYGEVRGGGSQVGTTIVDTGLYDAINKTEETCVQQEASYPKDSGETNMSNWWSWLKPKPTYFDSVTQLVSDITALEIRLRDDEQEAKERLHEIEAARVELRVRVFRG